MTAEPNFRLFARMRKLFGHKPYLITFIIFITIFLQFFIFNRSQNPVEVGRIPPKYEKYLANIDHYRLKEEIVKTLAAYDFNEEYVAVTTAKIYPEHKTVHCHYFDKHRKRIPGTSRQVQFINSTTVLCPKQPTVHFQFVDLSFSSRDLRRYSQPIPINRSPIEAKSDFAICVKLEVQPNWLEIVRFVEWHRKIGFTFFYLTTLNVDEYTRRIIDDYKRLGLVHLTSMKTSKDLANSTILEEFQTIQERNCNHRSRVHSKWFIHLGLNEIVVELPQTILASENTVSLEIKKVHRIFLEKYSNEEEIRKIVETSHATSESIGYRKIVRTGVKKRRWSSKMSSNSSSISPFLPNPSESLSTSVTSRSSYIYNTRPLYCDEIDTEIISWCPVSVYHCQFRDAADEKRIMEKRKEIQKDYKGIVYTW